MASSWVGFVALSRVDSRGGGKERSGEERRGEEEKVTVGWIRPFPEGTTARGGHDGDTTGGGANSTVYVWWTASPELGDHLHSPHLA